jgi:hypothetical protein
MVQVLEIFWKTTTNIRVGRSMAQAVSHRSLSEKARVHEWVSLTWVCGGQSDTEVFVRFLRLSPVYIISPWLSIVHHLRINNRFVGGRCSEI